MLPSIDLTFGSIMKIQLSQTLIALLALPASLVSLAACDAKNRKDTEETKVSETPNACVRTAASKASDGKVCAPTDSARTGVRDACTYDECALPPNGECPSSHEPKAVSVAPANTLCSISAVSDL